MKRRFEIFPYLLVVAFLVISLFTLDDYGINWDEPVHFMRGQAYLRYFLTGKKDYQDLPKLKFHYPKNDRYVLTDKLDFEDDSQFRRSLYQSDYWNGKYFLNQDGGHPPLNDILAAATNWIFYQKLGVLGDIESYHLFEILTGAILILVVSLFAQEIYGVFAGLIAGLSLFLYPLFWAESHFNIKDPVGACFFGLTIYGFYKAIKHQSAKWIVFSAIFCGMALGTKFNIIFIPLIMLPWLAAAGLRKNLSRKLLIPLFFYPFLVFAIFFLSWPYLWQNPIKGITETIQYYKGIGLQQNFQPPSFYIHGFNTYPIQAIIFSTPLVILFFALIGILACFFLFKKEKEKISFLWLLWVLVPILRVSLPRTSIYGGVRQIMEYIPAMALLAGLGANYVVAHFSARQIRKRREMNFAITILAVLMFFPIAFKMVKMHPNEDLYFNPLIGGLRGAAERNFPNWGVSLGNEYRQGINWLNENAEKNARVTLAVGYDWNAPRIWLRRDIDISDDFRSGIRREGEYVMELTSQINWPNLYYFTYVKRFLKPLCEVKVDGVPVLTIWKNDWENTREEYQLEEKVLEIRDFVVNENNLFVDLKDEELLTEIKLILLDSNCNMSVKQDFFYTAGNDGIWLLHPEEAVKEGKEIISLFAGEKVRFIKFVFNSDNNCVKKVDKIIAKKLIREI